MMQCGPAPLAAVRSGQVGFAFDTAFVFAEVNADVVHFQEDPDSPWGFSRLKVDQYHVGRRIVTKNPKFDEDFGDNDLEDITDQYKNPEGSMGERLATFSALKTAGSARGYFGFPEDALPEDVCFSLEELDSVPYGESFSVKVKIQVTGTPRVGAECTVVLSFQNPLTKMPLTNCTLSVEGPGLQRPRISRQRDVKPGELVTLTERFFPRKSGQRRIVATFDSQELAEITGSAVVTVAD